ncbi:MAG: hypothetical protein JWO38_2607 [Gemmataceae bacterium]|nr:hypothetical protein [Gemmataceae bacterium]
MIPPDVLSPELRRLSLLRAFKLRTLRPGGENHSPFTDRVATAHGDISRSDLSGLHAEVRDHIAQLVHAVRDHQRSQVVLLAGEAGAGKSHILLHFARAEMAAEHGYVFVGGANHWSVDEFQPCLLDWMIQALTAPAPSADGHLLLDRVRAIGFRAVGQLLENRTALKRCTARRRRGLLGRIIGRRGAGYETVEKLTAARDPAVFRLLDFARFSDEVCTRFLADSGNLVHRYALRVLLTYLFPDETDAGVGTRERVLHWFRRKTDDGYWARRLGVADDLTRRYAVADAIKLLVHLFSPDLSKRLSADGDECRPLVFLLVFDQAEGRAELFDTLEDWNHFFAHLAELYNTLPNVLVLFTMTLGLRNELHPKMERQFKDRIRKDERFVLRQPSAEEVRDLYRTRLDGWLADDPVLQGVYRELDDPYLPFGAERVVELGGLRPVRGALEAFDEAFHAAMKLTVIEPGYDFEFVLNEQTAAVEGQTEYEYTEAHLDTVRKLVGPLVDQLAAEYGGVRLNSITEDSAGDLPALRLDFADPVASGAWVRVYLVRFGYTFNSHVPSCREFLARRSKARYSVWMVRAKPFKPQHDRPDQMFGRLVPPEAEARLRAALHLLDKRSGYEAKGTWPAAWKVIHAAVANCYLGELFDHARDRVTAIKSGAIPDEPDVS